MTIPVTYMAGSSIRLVGMAVADGAGGGGGGLEGFRCVAVVPPPVVWPEMTQYVKKAITNNSKNECKKDKKHIMVK